MNRGFYEFFGFLHGANAYFDRKSRTDAVFANAKGLRGRGPVNPILRGHEPVHEQEYLTDALTRTTALEHGVEQRRGATIPL